MGLRKKEPAVFIIVILIFGVLLYFVAYPLYAVFRESVMNDAGKFIGPANYIQFIQSAYFRQVFYNTLIISVIATAGAVIIGTIFAYGMTRTGLSVILSSIGAFFATILGLLIAYLLVCRNFPGRKAMDFLGTLPYAVPGTMMGLGFVVAFNQAPLILTGTAFIIVLDYAIRRMPFGLRSGVSTLKQIDVAREEASADLGAPWFTPFRKIVLPLMKPAFIAGITFAFIRAITELTSTIFRVTPPMESDGCGHIQYGRIRSAGRSGGDVHPAHGHRGHHPVNHLPGDGGNGFHVPDVNDKKRREPTCGMSE